MSEESRFDWGSIFRSSGIVVGGAGLIGFIVPPLFTLILSLGTTQRVVDSDIYQFVFWAVAWGLVFPQGTWMLKHVGDRIIDDMLVIAIISALALLILRLIIFVVYGASLPFTAIDAGGAL